MAFRLLCYGEPYGEAGTLPEAKALAGRHVRGCPQGAMPWAKRITWYEVDGRRWVSAAGGEWIDHWIETPGTAT